jgi:hypothetical protein
MQFADDELTLHPTVDGMPGFWSAMRVGLSQPQYILRCTRLIASLDYWRLTQMDSLSLVLSQIREEFRPSAHQITD